MSKEKNFELVEFAITTVDNPFNPFTEFKHWFTWDESHGYHTCEWIAKIAGTPTNIGPFAQEASFSDAIDSLIELFPQVYKKLTRFV